MSKETRTQLNALKACSVDLYPVKCKDGLADISHLFSLTDIIIDALLGIGMNGMVREPIRSLVDLANNAGRPIISADIPTPGILHTVVCAFHKRKQGTPDPVEEFEIGIPVLAEIATGPGDLLMVASREQSAHKGSGGRVLIIGGGPYQGAPYLAGMAALRAGADIVQVASPVSNQYPDLIHIPVGNGVILEQDLEKLLKLCKSADVTICGPGLGDKSHSVIETVAKSCKKAVFDADALRLPLPLAEKALYTPHAGEFFRISGRKLEADPIDRIHKIQEAEIPGTVLLKGEIDLIVKRDRARFNMTGSPAMTTGGTGDILAGVCGALMCKLEPFEAACIGAYVTGKAGEIGAERKGLGLVASDLLDVIAQVLFRCIL